MDKIGEILRNGFNTDPREDPKLRALPSLLQSFEAYLSSQQIESFNQQENHNQWTGAVEDTNLFQIWKRIKNGFATTSSTELLLNNANPYQETTSVVVPVPEVTDQDVSLDPFEESFHIPSESTSKIDRKPKLQPPFVATSKAYQQYLEKIVQINKDKEIDKEKKRKERLFRKQAKEIAKLQKKPKGDVKRGRQKTSTTKQ
ncbi:uncharacterized protein LOC129729023 [Wyeomyia smithii]|uniref:uncharacterized protein LOC129729023 n=1 Tax=Wyeomyia smithii TaxID=174621 RepID=UPI002467F949|nr:uncharacterized protein LOC129729023 [Wyeomyia smithii]